MDSLKELPLSYSQAILEGKTYYCTGIPCKRGHIAKRDIGRRQCVKCKRINSRKSLPFGDILQWARRRAAKNSLPYNLTNAWAKERWNGCCELTGIPFIKKERAQPFSPSLDKIDPSKGYTKDNCRFILFGVNALKGVGTDEEMLFILSAFARKNLIP